jgi:uncharacterized protein (DUF924 family)
LAAPPRRWAAELVHHWFHHLTPQQRFAVDPQIDAELRRRFGADLAALGSRPAHEFLDGPHGALAAVILFDQVPRNIHRGTAQAFAYDPLSRQIARRALAMGWDACLTPGQRQFLAMPLMHSEQIADQMQALRYYTALGPRYGGPFARSHHRMIARFGRFPHRNAVLGRHSSAAELRAVQQGFAW